MSRKPQILTDQIYFGECPRWHNGRLWFSDFHGHAVKSISLAGDLQTELSLDDRPGGLGWMPDGSLLAVSMQKRQVLRRHGDGAISLHADLTNVASFHANDMVVDASGNAYVGNFGFNLDEELKRRSLDSVIADHPTADLALITPDGGVSVAAPALHFPNGMVIAPDGKQIIVAETLSGTLSTFDIDSGGALSNARVWAMTWPYMPDGVCLDARGRIWCANPIGPQCVLIAPGGEVIEVIETEDPCFACMLGGEHGQTLFMLTAPTFDPEKLILKPTAKVLTAVVETPHAGLP